MKTEKAILLSIKSKHVLNIINGKKTLELRRTVPKDFKGWVYIYVTKELPPLMVDKTNKEEPYFVPIEYNFSKKWKEECEKDYMNLNGLVVGRFWLDNITEYSIEKWSDQEIVIPLDTLTITRDTMKNFLSDTCLTFNEIWDYAKPSKYTPEKQKFIYAWQIKKLEIFDTPMELSKFYVYRKEIIYTNPFYEDYVKTKLTKAPQNWQYVFFSKGAIV